MTLNGWKRTDYDERFEMLYSSIIKQNSSWSQTAMSLTRSVRRCQDHAGRSSSRGFPAPAPESRCGQSHEAKASHTQSASLQKRTSQPWTWPDRDPGRYGRAGGGPRAQGRRRGRGWRETLSGGSENSIVISDEGTDWEASEEADGGRMTSSPIEVADAGVNALWVLDDDDDGFQDREHEARDRDGVISLPDVEQEVLEFGGAVEEEDHGSRCSSTASGPTLSADLALQSPCPACAKLFRKMGKLKHWEKSIEYDPTSLSCDQWVLKKIWRPRNLPNRKGELWTHLGRIRKRALSSTEAGETEQPKTSCSRPHVFLHRNLLLCKRKEALGHLRPCHRRTKVDSRRGVVQVRAKESRRQKKRKLCEIGPQEEGPLHAQDTSFSSGEEVAALDVSDRSDGKGRNTACRKLFSGPSVSPDPHRQRQEPQPQKTTQQDMETDARCTSLPSAARRRSKTFKASPERGALGHCPWVRDGGFRSMLAELEGNRNLVVHELDRLSVNKLRKCV
ncbi:uncharacterized protein si:ch211-227n13.3 isoform X2 [Anguilla anguilla]|uniref:uncharacterized protein si:ch211-227n13.3 isoform X2 n=1 Tax=Anguilla anguilla TaxID=7936 RepID=UPI0015B1A6B7|nr:uncharacterized protein si:ch211-227n13.3 isoform X2 [Anguilla anguilla]